MGRKRRPYLPGAIFHLTARTIRYQRWFTPRLRTVALRAVAGSLPRSGTRLMAVAIMPNHLHLVVQQGEKPLSRLMQPLLRRLALALQQAHGIEGPVFWRHYASRPCLDPSYARNAIIYTHLNPVRAGLCEDPSEYLWTSHGIYAGGADDRPPVELAVLKPHLDPSIGLLLFGGGAHRSFDHLRNAYFEFLNWRLRLDAVQADNALDLDAEQSSWGSRAGWGGSGWGASLSPLFHAPAGWAASRTDEGPRSPAPDMTTIARSILAVERPGLPLHAIRGRGGGRESSRLRHKIIRRLHAAGYRNIQIARFLDLSESAVWYALR
jgi:putative transposase